MNKLYRFYVRLDRLEYEFNHYETGWVLFTPKQKYTLGKQLSLLLGALTILFLTGLLKLGESFETLSDKLSVSNKEKEQT